MATIPVTFGSETFHLTEEQVAAMRKALSLDRKLLADAKVGEVVTIAGIAWIVLDHFNGRETLCLTRDFVKTACFDEHDNNYATSEIRSWLNGAFLDKLKAAVNDDRIISAKIDLTADDGLDDYGFVGDKVGLITDSLYRKHNKTIRKYPVNDWWWTATPYSTNEFDNNHRVGRSVTEDGSLSYLSCFANNGIRPFCIFKSSISTPC